MTTDILADILAQPALLQAAASAHLMPDSALEAAVALARQHAPRRIIFTGMGSSHFAAYPAFLHLFAAGLPAVWVELADLLHYGGKIGRDTLLVITSQSGETIEARRLLTERVIEGPVIAVTNAAESTLARHAQAVILTGAGQEISVATRTYTTAQLALTLLAERIAGADSPQIAREIADTLAASEQVAQESAAQIEALPPVWFEAGPIALVGRGPSLATALSGGLLLKETAKIPAEGMSGAQFRHGPLEIAGPGQRTIICAAPGPTLAFDRKMAAELRIYGGSTLLLGPLDPENAGDAIIVPPVAYMPLVAIIPLQMYARELALRHGIAPGSFRYIGKVTATE
jgi:glucosamine--fructose-6-phosphate aminotransferase (isomerizing)